MGTTCFLISTSQTSKSVIEKEMTQVFIKGERHGFDFEYLTFIGATGYGIMRLTHKDTEEKSYFGIVFKTSRHHTHHRRMTEFCYKEITEDMGPYQTGAPKKMLDLLDKLAPNPEGYAKEWRERCRARLADKTPKKQPKADDIVVYGGNEYTLICPAGARRGWRVKDHRNGGIYRMNARQLAAALAAPPQPKFSKEVPPAEFFAVIATKVPA